MQNELSTAAATANPNIGFRYGIVGGCCLVALYAYVYASQHLAPALLMGGSAAGRVLPAVWAAWQVGKRGGELVGFRVWLQAAFGAVVGSYIVTTIWDYVLFNYLADAAFIDLAKSYQISSMQTAMQSMGAPPEAISQTTDALRAAEIKAGLLDVLQSLMYKIFFGFLLSAVIAAMFAVPRLLGRGKPTAH